MFDSGLGALAILALIDSMSFGTLLIPIWLVTAPGRVRLGRIATYLSAVTVAYFLLGVALLVGVGAVVDVIGDSLNTPAALVGQVLLGGALVVVSQLMDGKKARARAAARAASGGGRLLRWRRRVMGDATSDRGSIIVLVALALTAVAVEAASMLPYLAAIGIIATEGPGWPVSGVLLAGYCLVMVLPAVVIVGARLVAHDALERPLRRMEEWLTRHATSTTAWIIGIVGVLLAVHAISEFTAPA
ncbi:GAP family protein [Microbacterium testaceum]|uniref:Sap, sulfolipid-1-addressing protein n=1 Tax=Microbacterium testaceum TaxID=2033 RepID=A0A147F8E2_MICTE|nr:GAP family protein [Microbacterium testaceum]KTS12521.1 hypothetical protein RSA3_08380 [Microbacterium testaceum]